MIYQHNCDLPGAAERTLRKHEADWRSPAAVAGGHSAGEFSDANLTIRSLLT